MSYPENRKPPSNSIESLHKAVLRVAELADMPVPSTVKLRDEEDIKHWRLVIAMRNKEEWTGVDLQAAGILARTQRDYEKLAAKPEGDDAAMAARYVQFTRMKNIIVDLRKTLRILAPLQLAPRERTETRTETKVARQVTSAQAVDALNAMDKADGLLAEPERRLQ